MSRQRHIYILGLVTIVILDLVYFEWLTHAKGIISYYSVQTFVPDVFTNLFYFLVCSFACWLIFPAFSEEVRPTKKIFFKKTAAVFLCITLSTTLVDVIVRIVVNIYAGICSILLVICHRFLLGWLLKKIFGIKLLSKEQIKARQTVGAIAVSVVFIAVCILIASSNLSVDEHTRTALDKFSIASTSFADILENDSFMFELNLSLLGLLAECYVFSLLYIFSDCPKQEIERPIAKLFVRSGAILAAAILISGMKLIAAPHSAFAGYESTGCNPSHFPSEQEFSYDYQVTVLRKYTGRDSTKSVFCKTYGEIWFSDKLLYSFLKDGVSNVPKVTQEGNSLIIDSAFDSIDIDGMEFSILPDVALAYIDNDTPICIPFEELSNQKEDELLINFSLEMLNQGEVKYFEYCGAYLSKYKPDLVEPFIQRYANGDFTATEISNARSLNLSYIENIAKSMC